MQPVVPGLATFVCTLLLPLLCAPGVVSVAQAAGDPLGQHHSPATQITPDNVTRLTPAWTHRNGDMAAQIGAPSSVSAQSTPILLPPQSGGHLVYCTPFNRVIALDPETGRERWVYDPKVWRTSERPYRCRGVVTLAEHERYGLEEVGHTAGLVGFMPANLLALAIAWVCAAVSQ